jgi:HEPN domain-containing protein
MDIPDSIKTTLAQVTNHYIAARYTEVRAAYNRQIAEEALRKTEEAYRWFTENLNLRRS